MTRKDLEILSDDELWHMQREITAVLKAKIEARMKVIDRRLSTNSTDGFSRRADQRNTGAETLANRFPKLPGCAAIEVAANVSGVAIPLAITTMRAESFWRWFAVPGRTAHTLRTDMASP